MKNLKFSILAAATILFATSCSKDDPAPINEEEVITTVVVRLTAASGATVTLTSKDIDGNGPGMPVVTPQGASLKASTTYTGTVSFLNERKTPAEDITVEVQAEGVDHQLFFQAPPALGTFTYDDLDANGKPIGLKFKVTTATTANVASQNLLVTLKHLPVKSASGVAAGNITNAGGATDAAVTFPIILTN